MSNINHWIYRVADQVEQNAIKKKGLNAEIICASGISPSGTIHLGNLREIITVHLVKEELLRKGKKAVHLHFWDDYDRFRKVPANTSSEFEKYIGMPLCQIPDPFATNSSYADHFMEEFKDSLDTLGIHPTYIRQSEVYKKGAYTVLIKQAMENRGRIFDILNSHQTDEQQKNSDLLRDGYFPFKVYCENCGKDYTHLSDYNKETSLISYACKSCNYSGSYHLNDQVNGKLVWKVDWPMRWKYYQVDFEPGGLDHSSPGSSYVVGKQVIKEIFNEKEPFYSGYAFVGISGGAEKISSSAGTDATPANALLILEPAILRWLYIRTDIRNSFTINFDDQIFRIYEEWDRLKQRVLDGKSNEIDSFVFNACIKVSSGEVPYSIMSIPFRLLAATYEITQGNYDEIYRILTYHMETNLDKDALLSNIKIRLQCAAGWVDHFIDENQRIVVKKHFDAETFLLFEKQMQDAIKLLANEFESNWTLVALTNLVYGIPKRTLGLPLDVKPTEELKQAQHRFFSAIYTLLLGEDTGPRLPTLFLSIGKERLHNLLPSPANLSPRPLS